MKTLAPAVALTLASPSESRAALSLDEQKMDYMIRFFADSDLVAVRSSVADYTLRLQENASLTVHWNNERVVIPAIQAPVGSPEAIDAITTASRPISGNAYSDFVKVRNELQGEVQRGPASAGYYLSSESDYLGQQLFASYNRNFMNEHLNVSVGTSYGWDAIEPLADDDTNLGADTKTNLHVNAVATQVLTPKTLLRVGIEHNWVEGLQHNPYRNVYAGGTNVAERHPSERMRSDAFVRLHQYIDNRSSIKLSYRLYADDWGIESHEVGTKLSQYITQGVFARYEYRNYTQTPAEFYRDVYPSVNGVNGYLTGDYRMADLASHLFGFALDLDFDAIAADHAMLRRMGMWFNYERYFNSNNYSANIVETALGFRF